MAEQGRIAVFLEPGKPFEIREYPLPEVEPGAILVKITIANVCGSDLHSWRGDSRPGAEREYRGACTLGHEMVGRVARLGREMRADSLGRPLKEGDLIAYAYFYPCRRCEYCLGGDLASCPNKGQSTRLPAGKPPYFTGAFGDYYYLKPGAFVFKVPDGLPDDLVASVNCAFSQVAFGLDRIGLGFGETVVIQGAGGLGINAVAVARERGAARVIVIDGIPERLQAAKAFGADEVIDMGQYPAPRDRIGRVRELTGGLGAHACVELVGIPEVINEGILMVRPGGRYLIIGNITGETVQLMPARLVFANRSMVGLGMYNPWFIPKVLDMIVRTREKYPYHLLASHKFPLVRIDEAFERSEWVNREDKTRLARASIVP